MLTWTALYRDGSKLHQIDPVTGQETSSERIDRAKLAAICLLDGDRPIILQRFTAGQRVIFRRRVELHEQSGRKTVVYLLGWQRTVAGCNVQHVSAVFPMPGGWAIENIDRWREGHRWFYPIAPVPADSVPVGDE